MAKKSPAGRVSKRPSRKKTPPAAEPAPLGVEDIVIALQKSFSRVSHQTETSRQQGGEASALALVTGPVEFTLELPATPAGDRLVYDEKGSLKLTMNGTLHPDIRVESSEE